jgi:pyruvate-formate lyase-activating enzyme
VDPDTRQDLAGLPRENAERKAARAARAHPENRLIQHLAHCCRGYGCPAARNLFLGRWEAPLPTSPACNARCVGCISLQDECRFPSTQERIRFVPTVEEILEVAVPHLEKASRAVVSFGQGCEGEPLMQAPLLEEAVRAIRARTRRGTINLNTNGSRPASLERLFRAGLDSVRVSLNSAREELYLRYFRPRGYGFGQVEESLRLGSLPGRFSSINYFVFPGITDEPEEADALAGLLARTGARMIQWRNLNLDPEIYLESLGRGGEGRGRGKPMGILRAMERVRKGFPEVRSGYFNPFLGRS